MTQITAEWLESQIRYLNVPINRHLENYWEHENERARQLELHELALLGLQSGRDAERYRWLQREYTKQDRAARIVRPVVLYVNHSKPFIQNGDDLNAIIDAEIKKES